MDELERQAIRHVAQRGVIRPSATPIPIRQRRLRWRVGWQNGLARLALAWGLAVETAVTHIVVLACFALGVLAAMFFLSLAGAGVVWLLRPYFVPGLWAGIWTILTEQNGRLYLGLTAVAVWLFCLPYFLVGLPWSGIWQGKRWAYGRFTTNRMQREFRQQLLPIDADHFSHWWLRSGRWRYHPSTNWQHSRISHLVASLNALATTLALALLPLLCIKLVVLFVKELPSSGSDLWILLVPFLFVLSPLLIITGLWVLITPFIGAEEGAALFTTFCVDIQDGYTFWPSFTRAVERFLEKLTGPS